ncbi:ribose 5-phosphate isomerase B [Pseudobdellovibrio exovorus]|uniref:Ribose 5-phosphate isomerase B n=1 Tax=Pseudobdellovibrio exovorus JSS TaxID=1184267 RepID=M4VBZ8_9BACT|nr:ribose 5-phosphate isomerase B [Pseudobdellovibrio exovorus]AGH95541.1 ribose 5-phosphate isomerase B [Pseudobdellovibrio exovorus JSS]
MKILVASDHAGFELKEQIVSALKSANNDVEDFGTHSLDSVDYPDYADRVCKKLKASSEQESELSEFGILICGSGQGMALRANKFSHVRAALVYNDEISRLSREHNNANIICIGSRFCDLESALQWINTFKKTHFLQGRHQTRVAKVGALTT